MPGIRNPFESLALLPRRKYSDPMGGQEDPFQTRRRSIYPGIDPLSPTEMQTQPDEEQGYPKRDWSQYLNEVRDIYSKTGPAQAAYESHLQDLPEQQNPSVWGRIVAGIVGAGTGFAEGPSRGVAAGQGIIRRPYERALEEWQNKEAGLSRSAELEEKSLGRRLGYLKEVKDVAKTESEYNEMLRKDQLERDKLEETRRRNDAYIADLKTRGFVTRTDAKGVDYMFNPQTKERIELGPSLAGRAQTERERATGVAEGISRGNLGVAQGNLGLRGQEVSISREHLGLAKEAGGRAQSADERAEEANERARATYLQGPHVPATEQGQATRLAAAQVVADYPDRSKFIDPKTGGILPPGETSAGYGHPTFAKDLEDFAQFMAEVNRRKEKILGLRRPGTPISGLSGSREQPRADIVK